VQRMELVMGDVIRTVTGGGGGYGDPREREVGRVAEDVRDGLLGADAAAEVYGVVVGPDGTATRSAAGNGADAR
jgi:N-methylhydantoinase B